MSIYATVLWLPEEGGRVSRYTDNRAADIAASTGKAPIGRYNAHVSLATIPGHCWPNGNTDAPADSVAPWVRLAVSGGRGYSDANLDIDAVRALRDALTAWLDQPHLPELEQ